MNQNHTTSQPLNLAIQILDNEICEVTINRPSQRNALNRQTIEELVSFFASLAHKPEIRAVILRGSGEHFCAGLDLKEHHQEDRGAEAFMRLCLRWHEAFNKMEYSGVPIIAALTGAVVGGGLELASAAHIRVADQHTYFALPEGQRGLFTGGGATIRVAGLIGKARMIDMMLTGRLYNAEEGQKIGLCQYVVEDSLAKARDLAAICVANPPLSNFAVCSAIAHFGNMSGLDAAYAESAIAGIVNTQPASRERLAAFANKTAARVKPSPKT